jgi:hypothetical protein
MGSRSMGKVPDLRRLAGRVAPRSTVPWSWPWAFPGLCFFAAVVGGRAVYLLYARGRCRRGSAVGSELEPDISHSRVYGQKPARCDGALVQEITGVNYVRKHSFIIYPELRVL